jgi:hypothetical protein
MPSPPTPASVDLDELIMALDWASDTSGLGNLAFVSRETGQVFLTSDEDFGAEFAAELPSDLDDAEKYASVPTRQDLRLGKRLALDFAATSLPKRLDDTYKMFASRGAYARFKAMLENEEALDAWHAFEAEAVERALREWAESEDLVIATNDVKR